MGMGRVRRGWDGTHGLVRVGIGIHKVWEVGLGWCGWWVGVQEFIVCDVVERMGRIKIWG